MLACVAARAASVIIALHSHVVKVRPNASNATTDASESFVAFDIVSGIADDVVGEIDSFLRGEKEE